jgi:hypothetical protein
MKNSLLLQLKDTFDFENSDDDLPTNSDISLFEKSHNVVLPIDLQMYFKIINGTRKKYDNFFFLFNSITEFKNIDQELRYHNGIPDYSNIVNTLPHYRDCYVFCDYEFHLMTYAIQLYNSQSDDNPTYVICGDRYRKITNTFSEFVELYLNQSDVLFI